MARWNKNEASAAKRRALIVVYTEDGVLAPPTTLFTGTNELLVDPSTGSFVAPAGVLSNARQPLIVADDVVDVVDITDNELDLTAHGLKTGDGPIRFTTTGTLPGGLALATDYWVIRMSADAISLATTLANALVPTEIDLTSVGSGTHTLVDTASTQRLVDGHWMYEATQAETNVTGAYFSVKVEKTGFRTSSIAVDIEGVANGISGLLAGDVNAAWMRAETVAGRRKALVSIITDAGNPAPVTSVFTLGTDVRCDPGNGRFQFPFGTWLNAANLISFADLTVTTVDTTDNELDITAHGLLTGDGPVEVETTGTVPGGIALVTDYWVIKVTDGSIGLASSLDNALAGTKIDITSAGTGTHKVVDQITFPVTARLIPGLWIYTAHDTELASIPGAGEIGPYFAIRVEKTGFETSMTIIPVIESVDSIAEAGAHANAQTFRERHNIMFSIAAGKAPSDLNASPYYFRNNPGGTDDKDRASFTMVAGVRTPTVLDGT